MIKVGAGMEEVEDKILNVNTFGNIAYLLLFLKAFEALQEGLRHLLSRPRGEGRDLICGWHI